MFKRLGAAVALALAALITPALAGHATPSFACIPGPNGDCYVSYSTSYTYNNDTFNVSWQEDVTNGEQHVTSCTSSPSALFDNCNPNLWYACVNGGIEPGAYFSNNGIYNENLYIGVYCSGSSVKSHNP